MGKPIVTDTLAASDYVENGKTGFLLGDFPSLVDKTVCLLNDTDMSKKMGKNARDFSCENFDTIKVATNYLRLVKQP
jgi:glycosyltransferase involved in cell wall biosynthesis